MSPVCVHGVCRSCQTEGGGDDLKKGTQLLEIYALEIQVPFHLAYKCGVLHLCQTPSLFERCVRPKETGDRSTVILAAMQIYTEQKNTKKLKELYTRALAIKSAIPHPRIMAIIRECGGKMHMHERLWSDAATDFFEV